VLELHSGGRGKLMFSPNGRKTMGETVPKPDKFVLITERGQNHLKDLWLQGSAHWRQKMVSAGQ